MRPGVSRFHHTVPNDIKIQDIALAYVRKAVGERTERPFSCFGALHPSLVDQLLLVDGELVIVSALFSTESWYAFTTRRIVSKFQGVVYSLDPSHGIEIDFPNFKGYDPNDDSERPEPGVVVRDVATITAKDSGAVVRFEYLTWQGFALPMYAAMYWDRKHTVLDKLTTTAEHEKYRNQNG